MPLKQAGLLLVAIAIAVVGYVIVIRHFQQDAQLERRSFGVGTPAADRLEMTAQIVSINPMKGSAEVRFVVAPFGKYAADRFGRLASDMILILTTSDGYRSLKLPAGEIPDSFESDIALVDGSPNLYPLDRYRARIGVETFARSKTGHDVPVPTIVQYEEDLGNYGIAAELEPESTPASIDVHLTIWRSAAILTFCIMMYAAIILVATAVLVLTVLVLVRRIKSDFGLMLWAGAMIFALPAVRNSLPDTPPLGIQADVYIFMWAETIVALSMSS